VGAGVAEPEVAFAVPFSIPSEPQVFVNIHIVFVVSIPVSVVVEGVDIFRRPTFFLFPNIDYYSKLSNFVEDLDKESVGSATVALANDGLCSILSNRSLYHNKNMEYIYNKPNPDHNNVSDTSALPIDATTNHPRKRCLLLYQVQRRHMYQV
jgi:hypothetical protein